MLKKILQNNIKTFNKNWNRDKKKLVGLPYYVEQFMYMYDDTKIYQLNNGYDNLELYAELLQRLDISQLRMMWFKLENNSCLFVCIYKQKEDYYIEYKSNSIHFKVWFSMWVQKYKVIEKKNIDVEIIWA